MVTADRMQLSNDIRTNGTIDTPNPWWSNAVVYQIYPRSFQDTNGDGMGDLKGITSRLDYLADLGVDVLWLSPVFNSPQDDNGYDISDYQDIDPLFGTLADMDELLAQAHDRGLKVVMDLVVNHTSDEHAWFQASRDKSDEHADWYIWRPTRAGFTPGEPGAEPNKWGSYFGGSAWQFDDKRGEYFLHQYSKKQPDLNWENPAVRKAVYAMMNWWMDRGIDGFRMDVITQISKPYDANGRLPGEEGSELEDLPAGPDGYSSPFPFCSDGPRVDEFLAEMRREVFAGRDGFLTVGEAPGITPERNEHITNPANGELDMLFLFEHVDVDCENGTKWNPIPLRLTELKRTLSEQQKAVKNSGWASLFFNNHDQPRAVSRWGDDSTDETRARSAKALGLLLHMHRGTPYIYQGEELGMTNAHFTRLDQYRDLESINMYHQRVDEAGIQSPESMMDALARRGRDNARTPMQWDASTYAGFTCETAQRPWIDVNANHVDINAAAEYDDPDSVYSFYKKLIELRHTNPVIAAGDWQLLDAANEQVYAFTRSLEETVLVLVNVSGKVVDIPSEAAALLANKELAEQHILLSTYDRAHTVQALAGGQLAAWEGVAVRL
ncbi:glycoside hydrolase family 13 protein [Alloscardovia sp. HMSC034E08]|uniref:glycoside hydrolase family 13 protein n=1 Tax=Alloscardovia sp. HMSC034E08 TaxID=1739413 RepID=UPI0008D32813|nr:alpha-glucosidase [Alloscardovia sp. HMSC034E08]OFQ99350.1 glucohydrolase [Alloscardovia sp. HMSC034E08]